jgi:hypothetical protein
MLILDGCRHQEVLFSDLRVKGVSDAASGNCSQCVGTTKRLRGLSVECFSVQTFLDSPFNGRKVISAKLNDKTSLTSSALLGNAARNKSETKKILRSDLLM